jgi:hypothetical protein
MLPPSQYLEVRYEQLIEFPHEQVSAVLNFLQLDAEPGLVSGLTEAVVPRELPTWPSKLSPEEVETMEHLIASTLKEFGYELSTETDPVSKGTD